MFLTAASIFVIAGLLVVAWVLAWIVAALAFLNFAFNICVGCIVYAQLVRIGLLPLGRAPATMILLLAPLIALAVVGVAALLLQVQRGGQRNLVGSVVEPARLGGRMPSILYFTGENCTICHTAQRPALRALAAALDDGIEIREIDIAVEPALARQYRVMSLADDDRARRRTGRSPTSTSGSRPATRCTGSSSTPGCRSPPSQSGTLGAWPSPSAHRAPVRLLPPTSTRSTICSATTNV